MEGFAFKNLSDIDTLDQPTDKTKLVGMENGTPVQIPADGLRADRVFVIDTTSPDYDTSNPDYGDKIKKAFLRGDRVYWGRINTSATSKYKRCYIIAPWFCIGELANGGQSLYVGRDIGPDSTTGLMAYTAMDPVEFITHVE